MLDPTSNSQARAAVVDLGDGTFAVTWDSSPASPPHTFQELLTSTVVGRRFDMTGGSTPIATTGTVQISGGSGNNGFLSLLGVNTPDGGSDTASSFRIDYAGRNTVDLLSNGNLVVGFSNGGFHTASDVFSRIVGTGLNGAPVNAAPNAVDDNFTINEDSGAHIFNVLGNDTDPTNDTLSIVLVNQPTVGGTVTTNGSTITFTPTANFAGTAIFTYKITDNNIENPGTDIATVTVNVVNDNIDAPFLNAIGRNPTFSTNQIVDLFANVTASTEGGDNVDLLTLTVTNVTQGADEKLIIDGTTIELTNGNIETTGGPLGVNVSVSVSGTTATVTITPPAGFDGTELATLVDSMAYENVNASPSPDRRAVTITLVSDTGGAGTVHDRPLALTSTASPSSVNEIISVSTEGVQGNANSATGSSLATTGQVLSSMSADARYVAFVSIANNLVAGDTNSASDVFLRDRQSGTTIRVSVANDESQANGASNEASISGDGNLVVFSSKATNLVAGDTVDTAPGIYLRNISAGTTVKLSGGASAGDSINGAVHPVISGNGQFVVWHNFTDVFLYEVATGTTTRITTGPGGPSPLGGGLEPDISSDGRWVVYWSGGTSVVPGDTNNAVDIFRYDRITGTTTRISLTDAEAQANGNSFEASVSNDGNIIAFVSSATNLVAGDPNGTTQDVFVRNVALGTTVRIPSPPSSLFPDQFSSNPSVSGDGRYVAFNQGRETWVYDLQTGQFAPQAITISGTIGISDRPFISDDGSTVVVQSDANNLVTTDTNAAGILDVFVSPVSFFNARNDAPTSGFLANDSANFIKGGSAALLDVSSNATISDIDSPNFDTGTLTVAISSNKVAAEDVLGILNQGNGPNQIGVSGSTVSFGGVQFATFTGGGAGGANLVFTFDSDATPAVAVRSLIRAITYSNSNAVNPSLSQRGITWTLVDGDGTANGGTDTLVINTSVNVVAPLMASAAPSHDNIDHGILTQAQVDVLVAAAIQRWEDAGATTEQLAAMSATSVTVADLGGLYLGLSSHGAISIDDNAAGWGWFVDSTPGDNAEFRSVGGHLMAGADSPAASDMDLLTTIMHELGNQIGLQETSDPAHSNGVMSITLDPGERHLPEQQDLLTAASNGSQTGAAHVQGWIESLAPVADQASAHVQGWIAAVAPEMHFGTSESLDELLATHAQAGPAVLRSVEIGVHAVEFGAMIDLSAAAGPTQIFDPQDHKVI